MINSITIDVLRKQLMCYDLPLHIIYSIYCHCKGASRLRQRRGQIAGLHNFGRTCFLNTLLQALAACPQFIAWLQLHGASDKKSLIGSLLSTLEGMFLRFNRLPSLMMWCSYGHFHLFMRLTSVINGTHPSLRADPYSPGAVLRALHALGWVIPPDEHDAHELLHVVLSSLEEEAIRPKKVSFFLSVGYQCK